MTDARMTLELPNQHVDPQPDPGVPPQQTAEPAATAQTVGEAGEHRIIALIRSLLPAAPSWVTVGIGDDAAVVEPERNRLEVLTTDVLVEGVHFDRAFCDPASIGFKALAVNLSDLAAMGAAPRVALLSLGLPAAWPLADLERLVRALIALATQSRLTLVGGNITRSPGPLFIDLTVTGTCKRRRVLTRAGARAGDELYVTGALGAAAAGLVWLKQQAQAQTHQAQAPGEAQAQAGTSASGAPAGRDAEPLAGEADAPALRLQAKTVAEGGSWLDALAAGPVRDAVERFLRPEPRLRFGVIAGRTQAASACMDLSDGLADAVRQMAQASRLGAIIEAAALPIHPGATEILGKPSQSLGLDDATLRAALSGGEDYELLLAVPRRRKRRFLAVQHLTGLAVTRIGTLTAEPDLVLRGENRDEPLPDGFEHFG
jgi:thiamine-monophosphate kinase